MDFKSMTKQEWQEYISVSRSYACKLQEPKDYGEKVGIAAYLFADAIANDKFPRYANKPYKDQIIIPLLQCLVCRYQFYICRR